MSTRVDPLRQLRPIREEDLSQLTDEHGAGPAGSPLAYDVYRSGHELVIEFDVPGVEPSELDVSVENRFLAVRLRRDLVPNAHIDLIECGRQHGVFTQRLLLGDHWDLEALQAEARHGVLTVRAPLAAPHVRRQVTVAPAEVFSGTASDPGAAVDREWTDDGRLVKAEGAAVHSAA